MNTRAAIPPPGELQPTLSAITERLASELASPGQTAPDWSACEWTIARAVAAMHGISPLLSRSLLWRGPDAWRNFLDTQRTHTRARHALICALQERIGQLSGDAGVAVTPLKGAALHQLGVYEPGERPMADLDILVRPADTKRIVVQLLRLGFSQSGESWKERVFTPAAGVDAAEFGEYTTNSLKVEVHDRICERLPLRTTDISEAIFPLTPHPGLNCYPSNASLMRHLLLHAAGSMAFQGLRILQMHDIALLAGRMSSADWQAICEEDLPSGRWFAFPALELTSRFYSNRVPAMVLESLRRDCPFVLRSASIRKSLVDVSYSYLWVKAFPGIEWAQSARELLGYAVSRVRPDRKHIAFREQVAQNQVWSKYGDWSSMSQARRIVRWMSSRQARPTTMHAIAAAFAQ